MPQPIRPEQLADLLRPGQTVFLSGGMAEPRTLAAALERPEACRGLHIIETRVPGFRTATYEGCDCTITTFFLPPELHAAARAGRVRVLPLHYRDTYDYLAAAALDLVLLEVAPPDAAGRCSLGLTCDFLPAVLPRAKVVVAEINHSLPSPPGAPRLPYEGFASTVESELPPRSPVAAAAGEETLAIARRVAELVRDGDCVQTGIGALPDAVLRALGDKNDLGFHSGLLGDGVLELARRGVLTGARKTIDRHRITTGFAYGCPALYQWLAAADTVDFRAVDYTHDVRILAAIDNLVSINSAVEVDLFGQVNAEMVAGRQISGVGGAVDFMRGAARSRSGRSIVALPATARQGTASRIVPALAAGTPASATRADVDWVVTEFGAAHLKPQSADERAEALCAIAAPAFRDDLRAAFRAARR